MTRDFVNDRGIEENSGHDTVDFSGPLSLAVSARVSDYQRTLLEGISSGFSESHRYECSNAHIILAENVKWPLHHILTLRYVTLRGYGIHNILVRIIYMCICMRMYDARISWVPSVCLTREIKCTLHAAILPEYDEFSICLLCMPQQDVLPKVEKCSRHFIINFIHYMFRK